jgi:hypothetical protein
MGRTSRNGYLTSPRWETQFGQRTTRGRSGRSPIRLDVAYLCKLANCSPYGTRVGRTAESGERSCRLRARSRNARELAPMRFMILAAQNWAFGRVTDRWCVTASASFTLDSCWYASKSCRTGREVPSLPLADNDSCDRYLRPPGKSDTTNYQEGRKEPVAWCSYWVASTQVHPCQR